jgi:hypothetical protein
MPRSESNLVTATGVGRHAESADRGVDWCGAKCGAKCGMFFRTGGRPRPRQHWDFARHSSPTTRPPHVSERERVRVVGLEAAWITELAGAGPETATEHRTKPGSRSRNQKVKDKTSKSKTSTTNVTSPRSRSLATGAKRMRSSRGMERLTHHLSIWDRRRVGIRELGGVLSWSGC